MDRGFTVWFTGLSGSGKTTLAHLVETELRARGMRTEVLDGDVVRTHLSKGLGYSRADRDTNILRIGFVCELLSRNGVVAIAAAISPYRATRDEVRSHVRDFVEVFVDCPLEDCMRRDVKGLYQHAMQGELPEFTGISDPYEPPLYPEITIHSATQTAQESASQIIAWLEARGYVELAGHSAAALNGAIHDGAAGVAGNGAGDFDPAADSSPAYTPEEEADISDRLEALGYM